MRSDSCLADCWQLRHRASTIFLVLSALAGGCNSSGVYPVEGQVNWKDGSPAKDLVGSLIFFDMAEKQTRAQGQIDANGGFQVTTNKPNDGALIGEHVVTIIEVGRVPVGGPDATALAPAKVHTKYMTPSTSDLRATIKPGTNKVELTIERAAR